MERSDTLDELVAELGDIPLNRIVVRPPPGRATERNLLRRIERLGRPCELISRTLVDKPMGMRESMLQAWLIRLLGRYLDTDNRGLLTSADGPFRLWPGLVRLPDLTFIAWEKFPGRVIPTDAVAVVVPDLAVEILSTSNTRAEMARKRREYFQAGVTVIWELDPRAETVTVYTLNAEPIVLTGNAELNGGALLPGLRLPLPRIFALSDGVR